MVGRLLLALVVVALAALAQPVAAQSPESWDSIRGLYPRQNYGAQVLLEQHASQSWDLPARVKNLPITGGPGSSGVYPNSGTGGGAVVERGLRGPGPGGEVIDVKVRTVHPRAKILDRVIQSIPIVGTAVAVGLSIKDIIDAARVTEGPGNTILMDPGEPESTQTVYEGLSGLCVSHSYSEVLACSIARQVQDRQGIGACNVGQVVDVYGTGSVYRQQAYPLRQIDSNPPFCDGTRGFTASAIREVRLYCPPGQVPSFWADDWCTTPVDNWEVVDAEQAKQRVEPKIAPGSDPQLLRDLDQLDQPVAGDLPSVTGPSEIHRGRETTVNPDGSTTVKDTNAPIEYGPAPGPSGQLQPGWKWGERTDVRTYPPGAEIPPPGGHPAPPDTSTGTEPGSTTGEDIITCGLPWTPACKIDESGTPSAPADTSVADAQGILAELKACLDDPAACLPDFPDLSWSFALPSGCSPVPMPFGDFGFDQVDMCQWQPMMHDLVSLLWAAAGLFGAVRLVARESFGS